MEALSTKVLNETGHPLVFIIDELDRCRPTFGIELLERVKHIFDVPGLVFVFGINRDELCKSLNSVYGRIDADTYLRRFFDIEFILSEAGTETFCAHIFEKFELDEVFSSLSKGAGSKIHLEELRYIYAYFPKLWARLGLSLRDIENCVRLLALLGRNLKPQHTIFPELIGVLIPLKFADSELYRGFVRGDCTGSAVMDFIDERMPEGAFDRRMSDLLDGIEIVLYRSDTRFDPDGLEASPSLGQLHLLNNGEKLTGSQFLTLRTQSSGRDRIKRLNGRVGSFYRNFLTSDMIAYLAEMIDLHQDTLRR